MEMPICMIICHRASTCVLRRGHMQVLKGCSMWAMLQNKTFAGGFNTAAHCMLSDQITVTAKYKTQHIYWFGRLRTKKGLQGGKTIQQRNEFFASLVPNASTSSLAHALVRSLHTCMCVYYSVSTQLWVAATLLLLPGAGTHDSDRHLGLIVVTPW